MASVLLVAAPAGARCMLRACAHRQPAVHCTGDGLSSACNRPHAGVFMGFVAPWLGRNQSWVIFAFSVVLIVFSLTVLFVTAFTNPGFLPRNHLDEDEEYG
jgi:hypothetical protein